ncbi:MAG TPA: lipopolysaccharide heptosyltransferase II [bacterium]|nr:lipopolysaccharide heptosyltransferase II [bacterium]
MTGNPTQPNYFNILVRVPNWLGDTMMATPTVRAVRKMFPMAKLTLLGKSVYADFWKSFPGVDDFIGLERGLAGYWAVASLLRKSDFDAALILPTSFSSAFLPFLAGIPARIGWGGEGRDFLLTHAVPHPQAREKHLVLEYLELAKEGFGVPLPPEETTRLRCNLTPEAQNGLKRVWADTGVGGKSFIALSPGATYGAAKRWPLPYWKALIQKLLKSRKETLLILGGMEEEEYLKPLLEGIKEGDSGRVHLLAGRTNPDILAAMLGKCRVLVTNDTGPMHVAAAVGTPTVALFGSTSPTWTRPFGKGHKVIFHEAECGPCYQRTCPIGYQCLNSITVEEVYRSTSQILRGKKRILSERIPTGLLK